LKPLRKQDINSSGEQMIDLHIHSEFSTDSTQPLEDIIQTAIQQEMKVIAITDHIDYDYQDPSLNFTFNLEDYFEKMKQLRRKYAHQLKILYGVELGLQEHLVDRLNQFVQQYPFDFVIGSVHTCNHQDLYLGDFYQGKTKYEAWDVYLEELYQTLKGFTNFSTLGHLDIIKRYSEDVRTVELSYYKDRLIKIFKIMIEHNIALEVNTSGLRDAYNLGTTMPSYDIIKLYKETGGKLITFGSDSHTDATIGHGFKEVQQALAEFSLSINYYYEKMKLKKWGV
jgi:histidinol-phosphatase (PHP family)